MTRVARTRDLVVGVDSSTQSTKVIAFDRDGRVVAEGGSPIALAALGGERYEQEPDDWWRSFVAASRELFACVDAGRVAALAIANQRETVAMLDATGRPVRPAIHWLDERGRDYLPFLAERFGAERLHRITGKPIDLTPTISRIAWLRDHEPQTFARTATFADAQGYLVHALTGTLATSTASADPFGVFDMTARAWSTEILAKLDLEPSRFAATFAPGTILGEASAASAAVTGLPAGTPIVAGAGDGQCAGLGTNAVAAGRAYLNLGTAIVSGVWSETYACTPYWRTLLSATDRGYVLETVQRSGAFLTDWFRTIARGGGGDDAFAALEASARALPIGSDGLLTLPYLSGCMNPHWNPDARGCLVGLTGSHGAGHIYRSMLEGLTLETARAANEMERAGVAIDEHVVIGGGARSSLWVQMVADATGRPARVCDCVQASALGAGMLAAYAAGWFPTIEETARAMTPPTRTIEPDARNARRYEELMALQGSLYAANATVFDGIRAFRQGAP